MALKILQKKVSPEILEARKVAKSMERELVFGMLKFHSFYLKLRDSICPYEDHGLFRRQDFSCYHFNILFNAIDVFYRRFDGQVNVDQTGIPRAQLEAILNDWKTKQSVPVDLIDELFVEISQMEVFTAEMTLESLTALSQSQGFADWYQSRVLEKTFNQLNNERQLGALTMEGAGEIFQTAMQIVARMSGSQAEVARSIMDYAGSTEAADTELIGPGRFLCREGIATLVGPSGIGKSTLAMQLAMGLALGRPVCGFRPSKPLKILFIQGENDDGDVAEMRDGAIAGLELNGQDQADVAERIYCCRSNSATGKQFIQGPLRNNLQRYKPDLVIIDPVLCYLGGDSKDQKIVSEFLRVLLLPELRAVNCGCLLLHHTNKPPTQQVKNAVNNEDAYAEGGSAEFRNVARAVITLRSLGDGSVFELRAPKRGFRLGWKDSRGERTDRQYIQHSRDRNRLFWETATEADAQNARTTAFENRMETAATKVLACIPDKGEISQSQLIAQAKSLEIGERTCRDAIKHLTDNMSVSFFERPRPGARAEIMYRRKESQPTTGGGSN